MPYEKIDCKADIATQDATYPTYIGVDCDLHVDKNTYPNFHGRLIDCELSIITTLVTACTSAVQSLRVTVTINKEDVTSALVGAITIQHNKNMISTFSLSLKNTAYSPLNSADIVPNKVVVITSYVNGHEARVFTGLIDDTSVDYTLEGFQINVSGSGYGKKLRNKRTTLVSIQDSADSKYRGALIKYLAGQAGVTSVDAPQGSYTRIDHSFEDQTILDMITKELMVDTYWWRFDEGGTLKISLDEIKTNITTYPTADWTYGEDKFTRLGLITSDEDIINTIRILGTVYETQIEVPSVAEASDSPFSQYIEPPPTGYNDIQLCYFTNSFNVGDDPTLWSASDNNFTLTIATTGWAAYSGNPSHQRYKFKIYWKSADYKITSLNYNVTGNAEMYSRNLGTYYAYLYVERPWDETNGGLGAFGITISLNGKVKKTQDTPETNPPTSAIIDNEEIASPTYEYEYNQVAANVVDPNSIAKYGERKPGTEGTLEFPLAENFDQCKGIGKKIIRNSHRLLKQPDFEVAFNPLLKIGQTVAISDKKIGYSERWYIEEVVHTIEQGSGRTRVGCVYYA